MNINDRIARIIAMHDSGGDPNRMMMNMVQQMPNIQMMWTQYNNMMQGRSKKDAFLQMAKQQGVTEQNIQGLCRILGW